MEPLEPRLFLSITSIQPIDPLPVESTTAEKPQSKVWEHGGSWWSVLDNNSGTYVNRLDGDAWTPVLQLTSSNNYQADVKPLGDLAHILLFRGSASQLASVQYVPETQTYDFWGGRPELVSVPIPSGVETATIDVDSTGRMWTAYEHNRDIQVRYSDSPYAAWSNSIELASNVNGDDIAAVTALPNGSIGVLWSDQNSERFGFRLHVDGADPATWSADEVPASESAADVGQGLADDHLNLAVASDSTLYAAVKTSFNNSNYPLVGLLVRHPNGQWDPLHQVDTRGTRPIVALNEATDNLLVAYRERDSSGPIIYKECSATSLLCGPEHTIIADSSYNNPSSTKQNFTDELVVIASNNSNAIGAILLTEFVGNSPPIVNAGPDLAIPVNDVASLDGAATDDGLPDPPAALELLWRKVSGPGNVVFADDAAAKTTATFDATGEYVLELSADDGELTIADLVTVVVTDALANQPPVVDAGPNQTILAGSVVQLDGNVTDDGLPDPPGAITLMWSQVSGPTNVVFADEFDVDTTATFGAVGQYVLELSADDGELPATGQVTVTVTDSLASTSISFQNGASPTSGYAGTRDTKIVSDDPNRNYRNASVIHAGGSPDVASLIQWDTSAIAAGSAVTEASITLNIVNGSSDSYEIYGMLRPWDEKQATWNQFVAGNAWQTAGALGAEDRDSAVIGQFTPESVGIVTIELSAEGISLVQQWINNPALNYGVILQDYLADDQMAFSSSENSQVVNRPRLNVTFLDPLGDPPEPPTNQPPLVNAGADQTVGGVLSTSLDGTVTDDGLPDSGTLTTAWSALSGPGDADFSDALEIDTTVAFSEEGTYVLQLEASDGLLSSTDEVTITVTEDAASFTVSFQDGAQPTAAYVGSQDTKLVNGDPTRNFRNASIIQVSGSPDITSLIQWDTSAIPSGSVVTEASITLDVNNTSSDTYEFFQLLRPWIEAQATWSQSADGFAWEISGARGASDRGSTVLGQITPDTPGQSTVPLNAVGLAVVQQWVNNPSSNHGVLIRDFMAADNMAFHSSEHSAPEARPMLTVTYLVPQPAATSAQGLFQSAQLLRAEPAAPAMSPPPRLLLTTSVKADFVRSETIPKDSSPMRRADENRLAIQAAYAQHVDHVMAGFNSIRQRAFRTHELENVRARLDAAAQLERDLRFEFAVDEIAEVLSQSGSPVRWS